jgi:hypothetical protein
MKKSAMSMPRMAAKAVSARGSRESHFPLCEGLGDENNESSTELTQKLPVKCQVHCGEFLRRFESKNDLAEV